MKVPEKTTLRYSGPSWKDALAASDKKHRSLELTGSDGEILKIRVVKTGLFENGRFVVEGVTCEGEEVKLTGASSQSNRPAVYEPVE
jgi:hypothetical protein